MMNTYKNYALICASLFILSGCLEEKFEPQGTPAEIGDEVIFGARAGFENPNPDTKTVYDGNTYKENEKVFHSIDWVYGKDKIEIYSPQGIGINPSCYTVNKSVIENGNENYVYAYLTRNNSNGAIQWSSAEVHDFYAMYPSSDTFINSDATLRDGVRLVGTTVNGVIPDEQIPLSVSNIVNEQSTPHWVAQPNMEYAYMVAHNRANRSSGSVNLTFYPIVTAVEIELTFSVPTNDNLDRNYIDQLTITHAKVESDTQLTGSFTCDLGDWAYPEGGTEPIENKGYPTCKGNKEDSYDNEVVVPLYDSNGAAITLKDGGSIKFTVFVLPHTDIDNLKVSFSSNAGTNYQGKVLDFENVKDDKGNPIIIKKHCKNLITNLSLPANWVGKPTLSAGNWITNLSDDVNLNKLSIPGTGGSFTFAYTGTDRAAYAQQRTEMDIDAQWELGIRAFEIVSDRPQQPTTSLGGQPIRCNKTSMGNHTVYSAIRDLINKVTLKNENGLYANSEMAVIILTYQPEPNTSIPRNAAAYAKSLKELLTNKGEQGLGQYVDDGTLKLYTPNLTIGDARNKVMIICRINQEGEEEPAESVVTGQDPDKNLENANNNFIVASNQLKNLPVLLINGCGTAKDKWGRRGYFINGNKAPNIASATNSQTDWGLLGSFYQSSEMEYYLVQKASGSIFNTSYSYAADYDTNIVYDESLIDFMYSTNNGLCWFQEWARVSPGGTNGESFFIAGSNPQYRWPESYSEKLSNAKTTFDKAISNQFTDIVVINSLCGYLIDNSKNYFAESYTTYPTGTYWTGGLGGNIEALAMRLNRDFYQYINAPSTGMANATGSTGIIMMDYVSNDERLLGTEDEGSYLLPNVIIQNNTKFSVQNASDANVANGGNAIMY